MSATEELIAAALRLAALAERNTDDRDEWQHAIDSVRERGRMAPDVSDGVCVGMGSDVRLSRRVEV